MTNEAVFADAPNTQMMYRKIAGMAPPYGVRSALHETVGRGMESLTDPNCLGGNKLILCGF